MDILEIRRIASKYGINHAQMDKAGIIHAIQRSEGVEECFGSAGAEECDEESCLWREDCFFEAVREEEAV